MAAQRYPTAFDGIAAASPVLYIPDVMGTIQWPQQFMNTLGKYPYPCELDAVSAAAMSVSQADAARYSPSTISTDRRSASPMAGRH